jgi:hypothetical protein
MTIFGPDISSYQSGLDLSRLASASFVIAKTTEGTYYTDANYQAWRRQAAGLGKPFVWYHFLSGEDSRAQAQHTLSNVGDSALPGMLDAEPAGSFSPSLAQMVAYVDAAHAAGLNLRLVYLPRWYWQQIGSPGLSALANRGVQLVSSSYPGGSGGAPGIYPGDGAAGWQSYGGMTPLLYQFTAQASDGGQLLDYNAFRGSIDQLLAYLQNPTGPTEENMPLTQQEIQAIAQAVYRYGEESVTVNGAVVKSVPLGNLAHGAWVALNDAAGAVPQMRSQVDNLFHRAAAASADAIGTVVAEHLTAGGGATKEDIANAVAAHFAQKLATP